MKYLSGVSALMGSVFYFAFSVLTLAHARRMSYSLPDHVYPCASEYFFESPVETQSVRICEENSILGTAR